MSVYNKELIIDGEAVLSPEQQVYKNAKDIKILKQYIKEIYHTSTALTSSSVSVATEDVEGLGEASSGWLLTDDGLLFKITANDGTTTLIQFFSDIKGPQGEPGAALNIDDSTTSATKVWSSQKTSNSLDKGIYYTTVEPELSGAIYYLEKIYLGNVSSTTAVRNKDIVIYINNGVPTKLYSITDASGAELTLSLIGTYSQGVNVVANPTLEGTESDLTGLQIGETKYKNPAKQLYQHNILFYESDVQATILLTIVSDKADAYTYNDLVSYVPQSSTGWAGVSATGRVFLSDKWEHVWGLNKNNSGTLKVLYDSVNNTGHTLNINYTTIYDTIKTI